MFRLERPNAKDLDILEALERTGMRDLVQTMTLGLSTNFAFTVKYRKEKMI